MCVGSEFSQQQRNQAMSMLRNFQIRIIVSTDLIARGVDVQRVSLVINLGLPKTNETYLHRVGRTGRFGALGSTTLHLSLSLSFCMYSSNGMYMTSVGVAVTLLADNNPIQKRILYRLEKKLGTRLHQLSPDEQGIGELAAIPDDYFANPEALNSSDLQVE